MSIVRITKHVLLPVAVLGVVIILATTTLPGHESSSSSPLGTHLRVVRRPTNRLSVRFRWNVDIDAAAHKHKKTDDFLDWGFSEDDDASASSNRTTSNEADLKMDRWAYLHQIKSRVLSTSSMKSSWSYLSLFAYLRRSPQSHPHRYGSDGLLEVNPKGLHPIFELMQSAEAQWQEKLARSSKTLRAAVVEYQRRYKRMPPKGFDKWWNYTLTHNVQLPDEYDRIHHDLSPFWGIKPHVIRDLQHEWQSEQDTFTIKVKDHFTHLHGHVLTQGMQDSGFSRAAAQIEILAMVEEWLPDFTATFFAHDGPNQFIDYEMRTQLVDRGSGEEYPFDNDLEFDMRHLGWASACPPMSPLRSQDPHQQINMTELWEHQPKSFIYDHKLAMDPCLHASHAYLNGMLEGHGIGPQTSGTLFPSFSICTSPLHADILTVANENWTEDLGEDPDWDEKTEERLVWRGSNTGVLFDENNRWELSQRVRLTEVTNRREGDMQVIHSPARVDQAPGPATFVNLEAANKALMDTGFVGRPIQCPEAMCEILKDELVFKPGQNQRQMNEHKYVMDIDGNGWSSRFKRLITNKSLILKATIFPEWYTDRIQPWVHYAPVKNDLTDVYDIMTFFRGNDDGEGSHDELAKMIATQGRDWSLSFWRKEDMAAYVFRLFLEYARVMDVDRESNTFTWDDLLVAEREIQLREMNERLDAHQIMLSAAMMG
ncbi:Glycosyltransferase Family 90 domain containing protein [Tulasnella sp. 332]|nr:Glycosyltransferase Family 90 domain containing protein [Tulasnella sp. 332]